MTDLMTADEAAAWLKVPVATLYAWRYRGEGPPAAKVGRYLRFPRAACEAWVSDRLGHQKGAPTRAN